MKDGYILPLSPLASWILRWKKNMSPYPLTTMFFSQEIQKSWSPQPWTEPSETLSPKLLPSSESSQLRFCRATVLTNTDRALGVGTSEHSIGMVNSLGGVKGQRLRKEREGLESRHTEWLGKGRARSWRHQQLEGAFSLHRLPSPVALALVIDFCSWTCQIPTVIWDVTEKKKVPGLCFQRPQIYRSGVGASESDFADPRVTLGESRGGGLAGLHCCDASLKYHTLGDGALPASRAATGSLTKWQILISTRRLY